LDIQYYKRKAKKVAVKKITVVVAVEVETWDTKDPDIKVNKETRK